MNKSTFEEELAKSGKLVYTNVGTSMMPLLRQHRDLFIIKKKTEERCRKYDTVLYKRGDNYVLHRILKVTPTDYVICGDHCYRREYGVTDKQILGIMTGFVRDGKEIPVTDKRYLLYVHMWCDFFYIRAGILKAKEILRRIRKRLK